MQYVYMEEAKADQSMERTRAVVQVLLRNRAQFAHIVERLQGSAIVDGRDRGVLRGLGIALKGSPSREVLASLSMLGKENAKLLALLLAYAVYEVN